MIEIRKFRRADGMVPVDRWLTRLKDRDAKARILIQIDRLRLGLRGDWKSVGGGVYELRVFKGKGYRVYFGRARDAIVILLCGGDKSTQDHDIRLAKQYWQEYRR